MRLTLDVLEFVSLPVLAVGVVGGLLVSVAFTLV